MPTMLIPEIPLVASETTVYIDVAKLKNLFAICDIAKGKDPAVTATSCIHYESGYLFTTDVHRVLYYRAEETGQNLPSGRFSIFVKDLAAYMKGKKGSLELDLGTFTNRTGCQVSGMTYLKKYAPTSLSLLDATRVRKILESVEIFGPNMAWQFSPKHITISTGSDTIYTIAVRHEIANDYFGTTPIVSFQSAFFENIPAWTEMSKPEENEAQIFSMGDRMYYLIMPLKIRVRSTIDAAFENAVDADKFMWCARSRFD